MIQGLRKYFAYIVRGLFLFVITVPFAACSKNGSEQIYVMNNHSDALLIWKKNGLSSRTVVHVDAHDDFRLLPQTAIDKAKSYLDSGRQFPERQEVEEIVNIGNYLFAAARMGTIKDVHWVAGVLPIDNDSVAAIYREQLVEDLHSPDELVSSLKIEDGCLRGALQGVPFTLCGSATMPRLNQKVLLDIDIDYYIQILRMFPGKSLFEIVDRFRIDLRSSGLKYDLVTIAKSLDGGYTPIEYVHLADATREIVKNPAKELTGKFWELFRLRSDADFLFRNSRYGEAQEKVATILGQNQDDPHALYLLAMIQAKNGDFKAAASNAIRSAEKDRDFVHGLATLAIPMQESAPAESNRLIDAGKRLDPANVTLIELMANLAYNSGNFKEAAVYYQKAYNGALKSDLNLGETYLQLGDYALADRYFSHAKMQLKTIKPEKIAEFANQFQVYASHLRQNGELAKSGEYLEIYRSIQRKAKQ